MNPPSAMTKVSVWLVPWGIPFAKLPVALPNRQDTPVRSANASTDPELSPVGALPVSMAKAF